MAMRQDMQPPASLPDGAFLEEPTTLAQYFQGFGVPEDAILALETARITLVDLPKLTNDDLRELKIDLGPRKRTLEAIKTREALKATEINIITRPAFPTTPINGRGVTTINGAPKLVMDGLTDHRLSQLDSSFVEGAIQFIVAPTASGKTRTLLEYAASPNNAGRFPFYFVASTSRNGFSKDLEYQYLGYDPPAISLLTDDLARNREYVRAHVWSAILARHVVLTRLLGRFPDLTQLEWLAAQYLPGSFAGDEDVFHRLTKAIFGLNDHQRDLISTQFMKKRQPAILDEAQLFLSFSDQAQLFKSPTHGTQRTLLNPVVYMLVEQCHGVYIAGTSYSLTKVKGEFASDLMKNTKEVKDIDVSAAYFDENAAWSYAKIYLPAEAEGDFKAAFLILRGRPRFLAAFCEYYLDHASATPGASASHIILKATRSTLGEPSLKRILGKLEERPSSENGDAIRNRVAELFADAMTSDGNLHREGPASSKAPWSKEYRNSRAKRKLKDEINESIFNLGFFRSYDQSSGCYFFDEPLLYQLLMDFTLRNQAFRDALINRLEELEYNSTGQGDVFEKIAGLVLWMMAKEPGSDHHQTLLAKIGMPGRTGLRLSFPSPQLPLKLMHRQTDFFTSGPKALITLFYQNVGPDLALVLEDEEGAVVIFCQCKFTNQVHTTDALETLMPDKFYSRDESMTSEAREKARKNVQGFIKDKKWVGILMSPFAAPSRLGENLVHWGLEDFPEEFRDDLHAAKAKSNENKKQKN